MPTCTHAHMHACIRACMHARTHAQTGRQTGQDRTWYDMTDTHTFFLTFYLLTDWLTYFLPYFLTFLLPYLLTRTRLRPVPMSMLGLRAEIKDAAESDPGDECSRNIQGCGFQACFNEFWCSWRVCDTRGTLHWLMQMQIDRANWMYCKLQEEQPERRHTFSFQGRCDLGINSHTTMHRPTQCT